MPKKDDFFNLFFLQCIKSTHKTTYSIYTCNYLETVNTLLCSSLFEHSTNISVYAIPKKHFVKIFWKFWYYYNYMIYIIITMHVVHILYIFKIDLCSEVTYINHIHVINSLLTVHL